MLHSVAARRAKTTQGPLWARRGVKSRCHGLAPDNPAGLHTHARQFFPLICNPGLKVYFGGQYNGIYTVYCTNIPVYGTFLGVNTGFVL
jgi:hypothetical protein